MQAIFAILLQSAGALILSAAAQSPAAVVEDLAGSVPGVQFMDYVEPGQVIRLGARDGSCSAISNRAGAKPSPAAR